MSDLAHSARHAAQSTGAGAGAGVAYVPKVEQRVRSGLRPRHRSGLTARITDRGHRRFCILVAAIVLLGFCLRLNALERTTLWYDEVMTAEAVARPVFDLIRERLGVSHSPAFYLLLKWLGTPSDSILLLRLPSAMFGAATVLAAVFAGRALSGARCGWMAGLLFALVPMLVDYGQEARPYSAMIFGVVVALWGAARVVRHPRCAVAALESRWKRRSRRPLGSMRASWLLLIIGSVWAVFMLPVGLLLWPALDCAVALLALTNSRFRRLVRPWTAHRTVCLVICLPLAVALMPAMLNSAGNYWWVAPTLPELWQETARALLWDFKGDPDLVAGPGAEWVLALLLVVAAVWGALTLWKRTASASVVLSAFILPLLVLGVVTIHTSVWVDRYLLIAAPAFTLIVAAGLSEAWSLGVGRPIVGVVLGLGLGQLWDLQSGTRRADWRPLIATLEECEDCFVVPAHLQQVIEIGFEWRRQERPGQAKFARFGVDGHPSVNGRYLFLKRIKNDLRMRGIALAAEFDGEDWLRWLEARGVGPIDLSSAASAGQQVAGSYPAALWSTRRAKWRTDSSDERAPTL